MDAFVAWLNPKGNRELAVKNALSKWWDLLAPGVRKRTAVGFSLEHKRLLADAISRTST